MKNSDFQRNYFSDISITIEGQNYDILMMNVLNSFKENFNTFNNNTLKFTQVWYETLLDHFQLLTKGTEEEIESSLSKILDIQLELEIKSQEIKIDENSIFEKTNLESYGIAV